MSEVRERRESAYVEVLGLTEALARIRTDRARTGDGLGEIEGRRCPAGPGGLHGGRARVARLLRGCGVGG